MKSYVYVIFKTKMNGNFRLRANSFTGTTYKHQITTEESLELLFFLCSKSYMCVQVLHMCTCVGSDGFTCTGLFKWKR